MAISVTGKINNTVLDFVRGVPFQSLNKFEVNLSIGDGEYADAFDSVGAAAGGSAIANIGKTVIEFFQDSEDPSLGKIIRVGSSVLMQLYAQSITVSLPEIETGHLVNGVKYIKDIKIPEDIDISFLEDEGGLTLRLIEYWKTKIVGYDNYVLYSDKATSINYPNRQVRYGGKNFKTDDKGQTSNEIGSQEKDSKLTNAQLNNFSGSKINFFNEERSNNKYSTKGIEPYKANMFIKPLGVQDESLFFPGIRIKGAFPKSIDSMTFSHDSQEFMIHKVKFSVDIIYVSKFI
jgi:hypothetical protein